MGGGVSGEDWVPLAVGGGSGFCVTAAGGATLRVCSTLRWVELERRAPWRLRDDFSTKRHCMMLVSFPPVEIR